MPTRRATRRVRPFHWLPPKGIIHSDIQIDSVSIKTKIWSAEYTRALCPEIGHFKIVLDNNNEEFSEVYSGDETVEFFIDRTDGTTRRFKGEIDSVFPPYDSGKGFTVELSGNHTSGELLTITVTESYAGDTLISDILDDMNSTYLSGYTVDYTATDTTTKPTINWNNKPFWECVNDLRKLINADAYVDDDKQINMFDENSIETDEAIVMGISMITAPKGIGKQSLTKRDKIIVYGESGDFPIISTSGTGTKEEVIFDSKIISKDQADELSAAQLGIKNQTPREGEGECFMLATLTPGVYIWYSNPPQKITEQIKLYKYTQRFPMETTKVFLQTSREIPHIFKKRIENELALQTVTNPFKMLNTIWNLPFDDETDITIKDDNVNVSDGVIKLSSGVQGTFTLTKTITSDITSVHLQVKGSVLEGTVYKFSTDGGETITYLTPDSKITVASGTNIWFKAEFNSADTEIESLAVHGK